MKLKIEHGIPLPDDYRRKGKYEAERTVMRKMKPGDSIVLLVSHAQAKALAVSVLGRGNYAVRKLTPKSCRVWRLKAKPRARSSGS